MLLPSSFSALRPQVHFSAAPPPPPAAWTTTTTQLHAASSWSDHDALWIVLLRGGEMFARASSESTTHLDLPRVRMRLEGLQAYGTLSALLANGCLRLYSSVSERDARDSPSKRRVLDLFFLCIVISILTGAYTTVVFTLLPLYSKTALGRGLDTAFLRFWAATAQVRETGLEAFLWSLVSFEVAFVLSLWLRTTGRRQKMLVCVATLLVVLSLGEWITVMRYAARYLFPLRAEVEY